MNRSAETLLRALDQIDAPDLWESITASADTASGQGRSDERPLVIDLGVADDEWRADATNSMRSGKRRVALVISVAASLLLIAGAIVLADRSDDTVATDAVPQPTVGEPVAPPAVADSGVSQWPLAFHDPGADGRDDDSGMSDVVVGGPGFVAVGERNGDAAVWTSVDGLTWSRVVHDEAIFGGDGDTTMAAVTVGGPGLVAVGSEWVCTDHEVLDGDGAPRVDEDGNPEPDTVCVDGNAVVWTSADGFTWSRVPHDEAVFGGPRRVYTMNGVTAGGPGLVAVGRSDEFGEGDALDEGDVNEGDAVVWTSVDGLSWSRVPHDETVFGGVETQAMVDVTAGGPGLVAVGRDGAGMAWDNPILTRGGQDAAVWTSVDGLAWVRVPRDEVTFGSSAMLSVTSGGPGLVAVGYDVSGRAPVWTSADGTTWSRVAFANAEMRGIIGDVSLGGPGLVAVGTGSTQAAVWASADGLTWLLVANGEPEPGTFHAGMSGVAATNERLIAVGSLNASDDSPSAAAAWTNPNP